MAKRLIIMLAAFMILGFAAAGCGDEGNGDGNGNGDNSGEAVDTATDTFGEDDAVTEGETATDTDIKIETETDETGPGDGVVVPQSAQEAIAQCKTNLAAYPRLSSKTRAELEEICEANGSGDVEEAREAGRRVCREIINDLYPGGVPGKETALRACETGSGG